MTTKRKFELFKPVNQAKVLWDRRLKPKGLLGGHLKIRSIISKTVQVEGLLMDLNLDFHFLSESWLTELSLLFLYRGNHVLSKDRKLGRGGGVLVYVRNPLKS